MSNLTNNGKEPGLFWWGTEYVATSHYTKLDGFELRSFFNASRVALPIMGNFRKNRWSRYGMRRDEVIPSKIKDSFPY